MLRFAFLFWPWVYKEEITVQEEWIGDRFIWSKKKLESSSVMEMKMEDFREGTGLGIKSETRLLNSPVHCQGKGSRLKDGDQTYEHLIGRNFWSSYFGKMVDWYEIMLGTSLYRQHIYGNWCYAFGRHYWRAACTWLTTQVYRTSSLS